MSMQPQNQIWNWIACAHRLCTYIKEISWNSAAIEIEIVPIFRLFECKIDSFCWIAFWSFISKTQAAWNTHTIIEFVREWTRKKLHKLKFITRVEESIASNPAEKENSCLIYTNTYHLYEAKLYISASAPTKEDKTFAAKYIFYVISFCSSYG